MVYAVILAAGLGTRMKTDIPKCSVPILKKPMVNYIVTELEKSNIEQIITVVGHKKEVIMDLLQERVKYAHQKELLGTANAVLAAVDFIKDDGITIILPGDTPLVDKEIIEGMINKHYDENNDLTIGSLIIDEPFSFGRIVRDTKGEILKIAEEYQATSEEKLIKEINTCMFVIKNDLLRKYLPIIDNNNNKKEYAITDIVKLLSNDNKKIGTFTIKDKYKMAGINDLYQLSKVEKAFRKDINKRHMLNGVNIINPDSVTIGPDVVIEHGVVIYPGCSIFGDTFIGGKSIIGPNTELENVYIGKNCNISHSYIINSKIENNVKLKPFTFIEGNEE